MARGTTLPHTLIALDSTLKEGSVMSGIRCLVQRFHTKSSESLAFLRGALWVPLANVSGPSPARQTVSREALSRCVVGAACKRLWAEPRATDSVL